MATKALKALKAKVIDGTGKVSGDVTLPAEIFGGEINVPVMHQVVTAQLAAARSGTASTKTRSEVRGGGKKPWRQKGTGRARHGSIRSPIWVGGGTVFGPKPRDYSVRVNKKMKRAALRSALADKASAGAVFVLDGFDEPRTKIAATALKTAEIGGRVLVVVDPQSEGDGPVDRAFRNLKQAAFALVGSLGTYDVLVADSIIFTRSALDRLTAPKSESKEKESA
jgi:large subunit ribosomal protein L4